MRTKFILGLLLVTTLFGCDEENTPMPDQTISDFNFSFRYDPVQENVKEYELLVSQKDGKVLLDTLIATRTKHALKVKSNDSKLNVTLITLDEANKNRYAIRTYTQVNPDNWHIIDGFSTVVKDETVNGEIRYTNIPYESRAFFRTKQSNWTGLSWPKPADNYLIALYLRVQPTDLAYLLLPSHGKYMFTEVTSGLMTVDFSNASTSTKRKYNRPSNISKFRTFLYGYPKAGDYTKQQELFMSDHMPSDEYDLQFPSTVIEEFELDVYYTDADGYQHRYNYIGSDVPETMPFASKSNFMVNKLDFNDFQVTFTEDKPSTYFTYWISTDANLNASWYIYSSPEETSYNPKQILEDLKPKLLTGKILPPFKLSSVQTHKAKDYTHPTYYDYYGNPEARAKKALREAQYIGKTY